MDSIPPVVRAMFSITTVVRYCSHKSIHPSRGRFREGYAVCPLVFYRTSCCCVVSSHHHHQHYHHDNDNDNDNDHGNGGSSICQGDSGGPLMDATSNLLLGVVSWNFLCHPDELPDGFIRVSKFHDWITEQICFYSRNPLSSNNECPSGTSPPPPAQDSVEIFLTFEHDFYPGTSIREKLR
mmetsp:Transcript_46929/g.50657  ORF Transcript_46929/g.50657 Transcript_46929/m.50657 type:complete len:181 (+) Transcript_46929:220-762(+)